MEGHYDVIAFLLERSFESKRDWSFREIYNYGEFSYFDDINCTIVFGDKWLITVYPFHLFRKTKKY